MNRFQLSFFLMLFGSSLLYAQGLNFDDSTYQKIPKKRSIAVATAALPPRVDWSAYVPAVIDQGELSTCVGVSTGYYLRTILEAKRRGITDPDSIHALRFSPSFLYNSIKPSDDNDCSKGTELSAALHFLKQNGVVTFAEQGYPVCSNVRALSATDANSKILDYVKLFGLTYAQDSIVLATKKALAEGTPVVIGIQTTESLEALGFNGFWKNWWRRIMRFFGVEVLKEIGLWKPELSDGLDSGHAVCVVGYDDAQFGSGAFRVVNSRGPNWGEEGFFWIRYPDYERYVKHGYQAYLKPLNDTARVERSADVTIHYPGKLTEGITRFTKTLTGSADTAQLTTYALLEPQRTGTTYRFTVNVDQLTYLYVLGSSASGADSAKLLFPLSDTISAVIGANSQVLLPAKDRVYSLSPPTGTEHWLFLFSQTALDMPTYLRQLNAQTGSFPDRVMAVFGTELIPDAQVNYPDKKIGFVLKGKHQGQIVPLLVRLEQVRRRSFVQ
jgi:Papain family cysteine protease/Domain of unknown function (DUF4384)